MCLTDSEGEGCVCYVMTECNAKRGAAMAGNRGKFCRCGRGTDGEYRSESLRSRHGGEDHTATAAKCGKRCRCGVSPRGQCCSESLRRGCRHERVAATAVNRVKSCRCGKMGRSGEGTDVRTSYRALLGAVRRFTPSEGVGKWCGFETPSEGVEREQMSGPAIGLF